LSYSCFELGVKDGVAHLQFCRPDAFNSMNPAFWQEFPEAIRELDAGGEARVLVLSSSGKHFCSGMDLSVFTSGGSNAASGATGAHARGASRNHILELQETFTCLERARMPVLAAIQGGCIGGGVDMVAACDVRYASKDAFFCIQEINIGLTADVGTLQRLPHLIPSGMIRELAYTGRRLPAERALAIGLVNELWDDHASLVEGVLEIAREIAEKSPQAIWGTKEMLLHTRDHTVAEGLEHIATWNAGMMQGSEMAEAFEAKAQKRAPVYQNLPPRKKGL
jgi:enoyl-CoA hydratase